MWQCLGKVVAFAGGCVAAAGIIPEEVDSGSAVTAVIGAAEIIAFFAERRQKHGPENARHLEHIQAKILADLGDTPCWPGVEPDEVAGWDWSLAQALPKCMLDREVLAKATVFKAGAADLLLEELAKHDSTFAAPPARDFAERVIAAALGAAYQDKAYFDSLTPYLWSALGSKVDEIHETALANKTLLEELLAIAQRGGIYAQAKAQGISETAVRNIVERLGGEGVAKDKLLEWLEGWMAAAQRELGRHSNEDEAFEAAHREADRLFMEGRTAEAADPFMALLEQERNEAERRQLAVLNKAIDYDLLGHEIEAAIEKLEMLPRICGTSDPEMLAERYTEFAKPRFYEGRDRGNNSALLFSIAATRAALEKVRRDYEPLDWARTQMNLGKALAALGERESGTARLEEAVAACRAALKVFTRHRAMGDWARAQFNLGHTLHLLGERESGTAHLEEAVTAYRAWLEEITRDSAPLDWASTQTNLCIALKQLGERESGTTRLEEAVEAYRAALKESTRDREPHYLARAQINLGHTLVMLDSREPGTTRLEEAVEAYRAALKKSTRERVPLHWAEAQMNLGRTLLILGERESGTARLEEAVAACRAALEEYTCDRVPLDWAEAQIILGNALSELEERGSGTARLEEAVEAYRAALKVFTRENAQDNWAVTQANLSLALTKLGVSTPD